MNATCALAMAFIQGRVLTINTAFKDFGVSNLPREASRLIETKFGVELTRVKKTGKSRYGVPIYYYEYRLPTTDYNLEGRQKMLDYIEKHSPKPIEAIINKDMKIAKQLNLL